MALGLEIVGPNLKYNSGICVVIARVEAGSNKSVHDEISIMHKERVGFEHKEMTYTTTSDRGSNGATTILNYDKDVCSMRDCDKIGRLSIRDLIRTSKAIQI